MGHRIGTILHGALGDCYEQAVCFKEYKKTHPSDKLIAFFAVNNRYKAFRHFDLSFFDEVYMVKDIVDVNIDRFYQFQIKDSELHNDILNRLPNSIKQKFDFTKNLLPWTFIRKHDFAKSPLSLELSIRGRKYLEFAKKVNEIEDNIFNHNFTVGFLWRYRQKGKIDSFGQYPKKTVFKNMNDLVNTLVVRYQAYILVCGMNRGELEKLDCYNEIVEEAGLALGERRNTFADFKFEVHDDHITYLKGVGFAVELEIMSKCDLLITMPSGFSEALWMKQKQPVVMIFPPLKYLLKLWRRRMPFFDNSTWRGRWYNMFTFHSASNVIKHLRKMHYLPID